MTVLPVDDETFGGPNNIQEVNTGGGSNNGPNGPPKMFEPKSKDGTCDDIGA